MPIIIRCGKIPNCIEVNQYTGSPHLLINVITQSPYSSAAYCKCRNNNHQRGVANSRALTKTAGSQTFVKSTRLYDDGRDLE